MAASECPSYVITFTGIIGDKRRNYQAVVASLGGTYNGDLSGATTHLVCSSSAGTAKINVARRLSACCIVREAWLIDSQRAGRFLSISSYTVFSSTDQQKSPSPRSAAAQAVERLRKPAFSLLKCDVLGDSESGAPEGLDHLPCAETWDTRLISDASLPPPPSPPLPTIDGGQPQTHPLVSLGERISTGISKQTASLMEQRHGTSDVACFQSAEVTCEGGQTVRLLAGQLNSGAQMLYDILPDGSQQLAWILATAIYQLPSKSPDAHETWILHRYLFGSVDLEARDHWKRAAKKLNLQPGEVLVSSSLYHSPINLVCGPLHCTYQHAGRGSKAVRLGQAETGACSDAPVARVVGAMNPATGNLVSLTRALR